MRHDLSWPRGPRLSFRPVRPGDAAYICGLRNDPAINRHLSGPAGSEGAQRDWIVAYQAREARGQEYYFILCHAEGGAPCGTVRIYGIEGSRFTWGSWILDAAKPPRAALETAILLYDFAFDTLGLTEARFDVRRENLHTLAFHDRFGAARLGEDGADIYFRLSAEDYAKLRPGLAAALCPDEAA
ncbi:GNAT family N-acetyltransferase [Halodurantibacterium flavum]|uniref:GNAT family N-acetyltransferase n=1 Tax=Halodurantibacterium flavum TaxID=1382802 RepID=A0ABW4S5T2_9RHOB